MHALSLVCLVGAFPALFCFRIITDVEIFEQDDDDGILAYVPVDEPSLGVVSDSKQMEGGLEADKKCKCGKRACTCMALNANRKWVLLYLMLSDADKDGKPELNAYFRIGCWCPHAGFDRQVPFNDTKEICGKIRSSNTCFVVDAKIAGGKIVGEARMTKPYELSLGDFNMPEA